MLQTQLLQSPRLLPRDQQNMHETFWGIGTWTQHKLSEAICTLGREYRLTQNITIVKMAAISTLTVRDTVSHLAKRGNWASHEAGVIVVFCIVFIVAAGLIALFLTRLISRKRAAREATRSTV
ncbi:hypothetical protein BGZ60DRAFT_522977 [Tricladium varicosporioides]|nr:hypothetical protein BGZ60DRAFT_522977 [Hymenoscyphus varicosporioides]